MTDPSHGNKKGGSITFAFCLQFYRNDLFKGTVICVRDSMLSYMYSIFHIFKVSGSILQFFGNIFYMI